MNKLTKEKVWVPPFYYDICHSRIISSNKTILCRTVWIENLESSDFLSYVEYTFPTIKRILEKLNGEPGYIGFDHPFKKGIANDKLAISYNGIALLEMVGTNYSPIIDGVEIENNKFIKLHNEMQDWIIETLNK